MLTNFRENLLPPLPSSSNADNTGAKFGKFNGSGSADTGVGTGDENDLVNESLHSHLLSKYWFICF